MTEYHREILTKQYQLTAKTHYISSKEARIQTWTIR